MRKISIAFFAILVFTVLMYAGVTKMAGGLHSLVLDNTRTKTISGKTWHYVEKQFYFNSKNTAIDANDYEGYAALCFIPNVILGQSGNTAIDSVSVVAWMTNAKGNRTPTEDSVAVCSSVTWTEGDTLWYRIDNLTNYHIQPGIKIKIKRQTATTTDSAIVKTALYFY